MESNYKVLSILLLVSVFLSLYPVFVSAESTPKENVCYYEDVFNAGKDTGYSEKNIIKKDDPHFGWKLGRFRVEGYSKKTDENGTPVFLKNVGDEVTVWFELQQNINKLNGNELMSISNDKNGYDEYFGVEKSDFGCGMLIVKKTDYRNHSEINPIFKNYLKEINNEEDKKISICEEGDYEIALDYEIRKDNFDIFGWNPLPSYYNYKILFKFSVKNGNCMVYPFDVETKAELTNKSITENGFYVDLANSREIDVYVKKEVRAECADGLVEDVRFNRPAKDHEQFTEEGIYTVTAVNKYTDQATSKVIYVGKDDVLKAFVASDRKKAISEIEQLISEGARVSSDGTLVLASGEKLSFNGGSVQTINDKNNSNVNWVIMWIIAVIATIAFSFSGLVIFKKKRRLKNIMNEIQGEDPI